VRARRYPRRVDDDLFPELREVLLDGWGSSWRPPADDPDGFRIFTFSDEQLVEAWLRHRPALLAEWRRRGRQGEPWGARLAAELVDTVLDASPTSPDPARGVTGH
jgi:hypothetical protein